MFCSVGEEAACWCTHYLNGLVTGVTSQGCFFHHIVSNVSGFPLALIVVANCARCVCVTGVPQVGGGVGGDAGQGVQALATKLAAVSSNAATAELVGIQGVNERAWLTAQHTSESNSRLWTSLAREQALRRQQHDRLLMMGGPLRVHCRIRPLTALERSKGLTPCCRAVDDGNTVEVRHVTMLPGGVAVRTPSKTKVCSHRRHSVCCVYLCVKRGGGWAA